MQQASENPSWEALLREYCLVKSIRGITAEGYRKVVKVFRAFIGHEKSPDQVDRTLIFLWRESMVDERGLSIYTWNNKVTHLRALYNFWIKQRMIASLENPFHQVSLRVYRKQKKTLSGVQLSRLYLKMQQAAVQERTQKKESVRNALQPAWYWLTVLDTFRYTGMRLNQLVHVRLMDINLDESYIELRQAGSKTHREWRVPIVPQLQLQLQVLINYAKECGAKEKDYLFHLQRLTYQDSARAGLAKNPPIQPIRAFFRRLSRECGFAVSPHRFRHTLATTLMTAPERNLHLVKGILGHSHVATTMEYIELNLESARQTLAQELALPLCL